MNTELKRAGHPMLAAVLTVSLTGQAWAEPAASERLEPAPTAMSEELELLKEEETVSIASRYEQPISEAPSNVYVITDEDIKQSGATDLPTVLRRIPGIEVMQMTGADFNVSARGDNQPNANKMLVMVDGRSIYIDSQGTVFWKAIPVTLPEIKRIEVMKGPGSAAYGFNAFDGVINIITKAPSEMKGTTLQFGGGSYGTITSAAIQAGTVDKLGYRLSVGHDQNQEWRNRDALAFRSNKINVHTEYALSDESRLVMSGGFYDVNRFDGAIAETVIPSSRPSQGYANVAYERPNFYIRAWWAGYNDSSLTSLNPVLTNVLSITDPKGNPTDNATLNTYNVEVQNNLVFGTHKFTYGINYRFNKASANFLDSSTDENRLGLYIQEEWRATQALRLVAGARYDFDTFIHPQISPRLAIISEIAPDHTVRVGLSIAYRPPTIFESNLRAKTTVIPFGVDILSTPSPNLDPEQIVSYDAEYQGWFWNHRLRVRTNLFFNHISNLITSRQTSPGIASSTNDPGQADIYGGEAGIEVLANKWLSGFASFSYEAIGQSFTDTTRRGAPRFKASAGLRGEWENGLNGEAAIFHVGSATYPIANSFSVFSPFFPSGVAAPTTNVDSYNLLNMRAGYKFWQQKAAAGYMRDAEVAVSVFNALNDEHKEHPLGDLIGRRVMGWLTLRF